MKYVIIYFNERLEKAVFSFPAGILADYKRIIELMKDEGPNLPMPMCKPLGKGLYEVRPKGKEGIARIFYCAVKDKKIYMLHCFIKKTRKTPNKEIDKARKRLEVIKNECG